MLMVGMSIVYEHVRVNGGERRQEFEVARGRQAGHSFYRPHLTQQSHNTARNRRPYHALVLTLDRALNLEAPAVCLGLATRIPQALERDGNLRSPAVVHHRAGRFEERVPEA